MFYGTKLELNGRNAGTLSHYFDLKALNAKLDSYGYGLLKEWKHFQQNCNQSLDVLFDVFTLDDRPRVLLPNTQRQLLNKTGWTPCRSYLQQTVDLFQGFNIKQKICIDPEILTSVQQLESNILRDSSCIGFVKWRGVGIGRWHFPLSSEKVPSPFSVRHKVPFSRELVQVAQEFAAKHLGNNYISVHIRSEWVLRHESKMTYLLECFRQLGSRIQNIKQKTGLEKIFLGTDFSRFGSKSHTIRPAQNNSEMLLKYLHTLLKNPHVFDPRTVNLLVETEGLVTVEMSFISVSLHVMKESTLIWINNYDLHRVAY